MTRLASLLAHYLLAEDRFPADLNALRRWAADRPDADREDAAPAICPAAPGAGGEYVYNYHAPGQRYRFDENIVVCPKHPELAISWNDDFLAYLAAADEKFLSRFGEVYPTLEGSRR